MQKLNYLNLYRARNHISPGEPHFAIFYHIHFQRAEANFDHVFDSPGYNVFGFHWHKQKKSFLSKIKKLWEVKDKWRNMVTWRNMVLCSMPFYKQLMYVCRTFRCEF